MCEITDILVMERKICKGVCTNDSNGGHLGHVTLTIIPTFLCPCPTAAPYEIPLKWENSVLANQNT